MASFKDTFTKEDTGEKNLDYDDSAFLYFAAVIQLVVLVPLAYCFVKYKVLGKSPTKPQPVSLDNAKSCRCSICVNKQARKPAMKTSRFGVSGFFQLLLIVGLCYLLVLTVQGIAESPEGIKRFDPYEILGIQIGASDKEIKSAFRQLSRKFHPDKNPGNNWAAGKYMQITKAYETLTNELAKANYEKYGNPDGPSPAKFAIGLPQFLLKAENQVSILVVFFLFIVVIIPGVVLYWINTSKKLDKNGVIQENMPMYANLLNENLNKKTCLLMIGASLEFENISATRSEAQELTKLKNRFPDDIPKKKQIKPHILKVMLLLLAHMNRRPLPEYLQSDLNFILTKAVNQVESMLDTAFALNMMPRTKRMSFRTFTTLVELAQLLTQGIEFHSTNCYMLPHMNETTLKHITTKKKANISEIKDSIDFAKLESKLSPEKAEDIKEAIKFMPQLQAEAKAYVEGEEEIAISDIVTVTVKITRAHLKEGEQAGPVHAPQFPFSKLEKLWVCVGDSALNKLVFLKAISTQDRVVEDSSFKFPISSITNKPGTFKWEVHVKSDSYYGLDVVVPLEFQVKKDSDVNREVFVHPDDEKIEQQGTWIQQMMQVDSEGEESSEEEIPELQES